MRKAQSIGMSVGILIAGVIMLVEAIVRGKIPFSVAAVLFLSEGVWYTVQGINVEHNKKLILVCGITVTIYGLFMFVAWILELCGVIYR